MNRHDWMKVLTQGCPPPKPRKKQKALVEIQGIQLERDTGNFSQLATKGETKKKITNAEKLAQLQLEKINHFRNSKGIHVNGSDIPPPIENFDQLSSDYEVGPQVIKNLLAEKYQEPTPIQMQIWPLMLRRREVLACAPTGSGKTAGFLLPIIHHLKQPLRKGFRAIILAPTRELAKQIVRESDRLAEGTGLKTSIISKVKSASGSKFFKKFDILVTTPNRLIFLMQEKESLADIMTRVKWLIVDESDKLFEAGKKGFRDQLASVFVACSGPDLVRGMFSATCSFDVEEWCKMNLFDTATVSIGARNACPDVDQYLSFCNTNAGKIMEIHNILRKGYEIPCLIFVQTKERAKSLCQEILLTGRPVQCIHSDISQTKRDIIVREFREKKIWILICTELMGRGIDFKGVNLVINFDFPPSIVSYVHRIGRTGRAGRKGKAITFWSLEDKPLLRNIGHVMKSSGSEVPDWILNLKNSSVQERRMYAKQMPDRGDLNKSSKNYRRNMNEGEQKQKSFNNAKRKQETPSQDDDDKEKDVSPKKKKKKKNTKK